MNQFEDGSMSTLETRQWYANAKLLLGVVHTAGNDYQKSLFSAISEGRDVLALQAREFATLGAGGPEQALDRSTALYCDQVCRSLALADAIYELSAQFPLSEAHRQTLESYVPSWLGTPRDVVHDLFPEVQKVGYSASKEDFMHTYFDPLWTEEQTGSTYTLYDMLNRLVDRAAIHRQSPRLSHEDYMVLTAFLVHEVEHTKETKNDIIMTPYAVAHHAVSFHEGHIKDYLQKKQPIVVKRGISPEEKTKIQQRHKLVLSVLSEVGHTTLVALTDTDYSGHAAARYFIEHLDAYSHNRFHGTLCTRLVGERTWNFFAAPFWVRAMFANGRYEEDEWYTRFANNVIDVFSQKVPCYLLFASDVKERIGEPSDENMESVWQEFVDLTDTIASLSGTSFIDVRLYGDQLYRPDVPKDMRFLHIAVIGDREENTVIIILSAERYAQNRSDLRRAFARVDVTDSSDPVHLYVVDEEHVDDRVRLGILMAARAALRDEADRLMRNHARPAHTESSDRSVVVYSARPKGPRRQLPKPTKRRSEEHQTDRDTTEAREALHIVAEEALQEVRRQYDLVVVPEAFDHIPASIKDELWKAVQKYQDKGLGRVKFIRYRMSDNGNRLLSLRVRQIEWRVLFEVYGNTAVFLEAYPRSEQDVRLDHYY